MTFPPALTWMHLLPSAASFDCAGCPPWLCAHTAKVESAGQPRTRLLFEQTAAELMKARSSDAGFVAVNCDSIKAADFVAAGFHYIRGFAAIPNLASARWFIPLDSGAISSAGFGLYSPTRLSARLKKSAIRGLAQAGVPIWYRDQVWIVQRQQPPLEQLIAEALGGRPFRLALSAGAPEPALNRKASAAVIGMDGQIIAYAKISGSPLAHRLLENESACLAMLGGNALVRDSVPRLLGSGKVDERFVLLQCPVTGTAAGQQLTDAHRTFLRSLQSEQLKVAVSTAFVTDLLSKVANIHSASASLHRPLLGVVAALSDCVIPSTVVHGDFAPWNIRARNHNISCFDWEYGRADGLPLIDEAHHELQVGYLLKNWTIEQADRRLNELAALHPRIAPRHVAALENLYLIDVLARLADEGYTHDNAMVQWTQLLLNRRVSRNAPLGVAA